MNVFYSTEEKILKADTLLYSGRFIKAQRLYKEILEEEPACAQAHYGTALIMRYLLSDFKMAEEHFRLALHFDPLYAAACEEYLKFLLHVKKYTRLHELALQALAVPGIKRAFVFTLQGKANEEAGDFAEALNHYEKAARCCTDEYDYYDLNSDISRVKDKLKKGKTVNYILS